MAKNVFDVLQERGFIKQSIYTEELYDLLGKESVPFYVGFDPTADSLHIGHYIPIMAMAWMQRYGHKPIALFGGGTGMIGDPSGRSDMRQMMTVETIKHNIETLKLPYLIDAHSIKTTDKARIEFNNRNLADSLLLYDREDFK